MKRIIKSNSVTYLLHILIWSGLLLLPYLVSDGANNYKIGSIPGLLFTLTGFMHIAIFYINAFYLYPQLYNRHYWWLYIISSMLLVGLFIKWKYAIIAGWFPGTFPEEILHKFVLAPSLVFFVISIVYRNIRDKIDFEGKLKEKQAAQLLTELKFLRSQISPHFLFNVLTNLVSLARKKSDKLEQSLIMLSELMRYTLYDWQGKKVELRKEVEYLQNYIELQRLRFGNDVQITCRIDLNAESNRYTLEPMLLLPFVENAFKHVAVYARQAYIYISLSAKSGLLTFKVENNFDPERPVSSEENSGIGLNNVTSRLALLYPNQYTLTVKGDRTIFYILLTLEMP